jgi:hypothetical protein
MRFRPLSLIGLTLLAAACNNTGGQTGDLSGQNGHEEGSGTGTVDSPANCKEERRKLAGFDEETDLGTPEALLSFAERSFDAPLTWQPRSGQSWHVGPETGPSSIHVEVTRGQNAYYVTSSPKPPPGSPDGSGNGLAAEIGSLCPAPRLAVDARVTVSSEGGALSETFDTTLYASYPGVASFSVPLDLDELGGTLAFDYDDAETELVQVALGATFTEAGMAGSISGIVQRTTAGGVTGGAVSAGGGLIAVWPASPACAADPHGDPSGIEVAPDESALGITGSAAAERLAQSTPAQVAWRDGSVTELTLGVEVTGAGCLRASTLYGLGEGSTNYPARFTLDSADGRLHASYDGLLVTTLSGTGAVHAEAHLELTLEQLTQSGFADVEVPSEADRLGVRFSVDVDDDGRASGLVQLSGLADPPCLTDPQPVPEPGGGASSPGCAGTTITAIESTVWATDL